MNRKMTLSEEGSIILDDVTEQLSLDRPVVIQIALAKGLQKINGIPEVTYDKGVNKWTIPDNIIKENNYILFKYLIQNEAGRPINNDELHKYMIDYIEFGLRELNKISKEKASMEDLRIAIL